MTCTAVGFPLGEDLVEIFRRGLTEENMETCIPTLVDMRQFRGAINWGAVREVSEMADWGGNGDRRPRVAFVSSSTLFQMIVKVVGVFFPRAHFKGFAHPDKALIWLKERQPLPAAAD